MPKPILLIRNKKVSTYYVLGLFGILLSLIWLLMAEWIWKESMAFALMLFGAGLTASYIFNVVKLFFSDNKEYSLYHYFLLLALVSFIVAQINGRNIGHTMDLFVVSFSLIAMVGRIGCYHAGCCHGIPASRGTIYAVDFRKFGMKAKWLGCPLFPTQLFESIFHALNIIGGVLLILYTGEGVAALFLTVGYAVFRFWIEFKRGDERPSLLGVSEAQYTSTSIVIFMVPVSIVFFPWTLSGILLILASQFIFIGLTIYHYQERQLKESPNYLTTKKLQN